MEKTAHLVAMYRIVGTVKIQYQLFGWFFVRLDEYLQKAPADLPTHFLGRAIFKSAQRRIAGQGSIPAYGCLQHGVLAQIDMIVEVIVALGKTVYPLPEKIPEAMLAFIFDTRIINNGRNPVA